MRRKMVWSVTALLAGAGFAAAQDVDISAGRMEANTIQPASQVVVGSGVYSDGGCGSGLCASGCSGARYDHKFYGSLEAVVWRLGNSFSGSGNERLPSIRAQMPFGVLSRSLVIDTIGGTTATRDVVNTFGIASISPVLFSGSTLDGQDRSGGRLTLGVNLNDEWAAELTYFQLERKGAAFTAGAGNVVEGFTNGLSNLVIDLVGSTEEPTTFNPSVQVAIEGRSSSKFFGLDAVVKHHAFTVGQTRFSELYGARFLQYEESQNLAQVLSFSDPVFVGSGGDPATFVPGVTNFTTLLGNYSVRNQFYGFTIGGKIEGDWSRFYYNLTGKFSAGAVRSELNANEIVFTSETTEPIPPTVFPTSPTIHENRTRMAFVLEGGVNGGYRLTDCLSVYAGYNVIVVSKLTRPISGGGFPSNGSGTVALSTGGAGVPSAGTAQFNEHRFVAHGVNLGLEFRF